jgi:hypothetical protein
MNINKMVSFIVTLLFALCCFMIDMQHNSLARLGIYEFLNPTLVSIACSLLITLIIFSVRPMAIAAVLFLCLLANLPPSALGSGLQINQDVIFTILIVVLLLPTAQRWIEN